jgi:hypothetical protein
MRRFGLVTISTSNYGDSGAYFEGGFDDLDGGFSAGFSAGFSDGFSGRFGRQIGDEPLGAMRTRPLPMVNRGNACTNTVGVSVSGCRHRSALWRICDTVTPTVAA